MYCTSGDVSAIKPNFYAYRVFQKVSVILENWAFLAYVKKMLNKCKPDNQQICWIIKLIYYDLFMVSLISYPSAITPRYHQRIIFSLTRSSTHCRFMLHLVIGALETSDRLKKKGKFTFCKYYMCTLVQD